MTGNTAGDTNWTYDGTYNTAQIVHSPKKCTSLFSSRAGSQNLAKTLTCLLRGRHLAFNFIDFDFLGSACQISKSRQKIWGSGQTSTIIISYKVQVGRP